MDYWITSTLWWISWGRKGVYYEVCIESWRSKKFGTIARTEYSCANRPVNYLFTIPNHSRIILIDMKNDTRIRMIYYLLTKKVISAFDISRKTAIGAALYMQFGRDSDTDDHLPNVCKSYGKFFQKPSFETPQEFPCTSNQSSYFCSEN